MLERLLDGDSDTSIPMASTPTGSLARLSDTSPLGSVPLLVYSSSTGNNSGNPSHNSVEEVIPQANTSNQTPNQDEVNSNFEKGRHLSNNKDLFNYVTFSIQESHATE